MVGFRHRLRLLAEACWLGGPARRDLYRVSVLALASGVGPYATAWQLAQRGVSFPIGYWPWPVSLGPLEWYGLMAAGWAVFVGAVWPKA